MIEHHWICAACLHDFDGSMEDWIKPCPNCGLDQVEPFHEDWITGKRQRVASVKTINGIPVEGFYRDPIEGLKKLEVQNV